MLYVAHALKGTLATFGAEPAARLAGVVEKCARAGDTAGAARALSRMDEQVDRLLAVLRSPAMKQEGK